MPKPEASVVVLVQAHKIQRAALCYGTNKRVSLSFLWVKIMTVQEQKLCHWRKVSWLESKFALGRRVTPKAFKQIFHSQKPIQVNKCFKEHSRDPEALPDLLRAQIPRLVHTEWPIYVCLCWNWNREAAEKWGQNRKNKWHHRSSMTTFANTEVAYFSWQVKTFRRVLPEGWAELTFTGIMTKPGGGAGVALLRDENESSSCALQALGVPGLCTASHRRGQNLVGAQTTQPLCGRHLGSHLGFAQTGCPVINPSGRVSPGGTTHSAATEQGFRGIWVGRALSDTASLWLTSGTKDFRPSFV